MDTEMLISDGKSVKEQNFIDLHSIFNVEGSDMVQEPLPTINATPWWKLDLSVFPKEIQERFRNDSGTGRQVNT